MDNDEVKCPACGKPCSYEMTREGGRICTSTSCTACGVETTAVKDESRYPTVGDMLAPVAADQDIRRGDFLAVDANGNVRPFLPNPRKP